MKKLLRMTVLFFDEQTMIGQLVMDNVEINLWKTAHNGGHGTEDWGGIPIAIAFGDDYQLPLSGLGGNNSFKIKGE